ncbi:MAG: 2-amino-4-hydroxy-6-hydroxymethyldihydropteridine diphosphokinase [Candidatus Sumerlaeota bacterium]|nr:2-amino-4-hydroxy-6-hydroxymethyldihydropteridine diphosphokinase [Candidatus Sumerlaeota bacterium]
MTASLHLSDSDSEGPCPELRTPDTKRRTRNLEPIVIGMGGNIEPRLQRLQDGVAGIARIPGATIRAISPVYETEPWGMAEQPKFLNAAVLIECTLEPLELLDALLAIERACGRDRSAESIRWGPRALDLDILFISDKFIEYPRLSVPHPRLYERAFALRPLLDVLPDARDPRDGRPLRARLEALAQRMPEGGMKRIAKALAINSDDK